jgi:hypothetical protein
LTFHPQHLEEIAGAMLGVAETETTGNYLFGQTGRFHDQWLSSHEIRGDDIPLPIPRKKALFPPGCELERAYISFHFRPGDDEHWPKQADYQVRVEAVLFAEAAMFELQDHWRVDTNIPFESSDVDEASAPHEPHPNFHFQRGGHAQDAFASVPTFMPGLAQGLTGAWRGLFQCPGPRVPALPMDPVLALDFCIGQSDGIAWQRLRNIPEYFGAIERAQERIWQPFFSALSNRDFQRNWLGTFAI